MLPGAVVTSEEGSELDWVTPSFFFPSPLFSMDIIAIECIYKKVCAAKGENGTEDFGTTFNFQCFCMHSLGYNRIKQRI